MKAARPTMNEPAKPLLGSVARRRQARPDAPLGWLLVSPTMLLLAVASLGPVLYVVFLSFQRWFYTRSLAPEAIGLDNWSRLLGDEVFWTSMRTTLTFLALTLPTELALGLGLALLLNRQLRARNYLRAVLMLPMMISPVVIALIWKMMYAVPFGPLNSILQSLGITKSDILWLGEPSTALFSIVIATVWQWYPFSFLIYTAGLQTIPTEEYEAAAMDGAGQWSMLRAIILPHLAPFTLVILLSRLLDGFKTFAIVFNLTGGGPGDATNLISFQVYRTAFSSFNLGYGSTLAVALMLVMLVCAFFVVWLARRAGGRV
jgi:multiple sugar transport system permease protein